MGFKVKIKTKKFNYKLLFPSTLWFYCSLISALPQLTLAQSLPSLPSAVEVPTPPTSLPDAPATETFPDDPFLPPEGYAPSPFEQTPNNQFNVYRLDIGDGVGITLRDFPEFNTAGIVDPEGQIIMPILGKIAVVGLTLAELETKVRFELSRRYLKVEPEVIAVLLSPRPVELTILGEVVRPGYYTIGANTPMSTVLLAAGGATTTADLRSVIVRRTLLDGTVIEKTVDLYTPLQTGKKVPTVRLQGGDTLIVSRLQVGSDRDYDRSLVARTTIVQPSITIRVLSYAAGGVGTINVPNGSTFLDIIGSVAPNPDNANLGDISLMRFDPEKGGLVSQTIDAKRAILGDIAQNVPLQDEDVIIVGRSLLGKINFLLNTLSQPIQSFTAFRAFFQSLPAVLVPSSGNNNDN